MRIFRFSLLYAALALGAIYLVVNNLIPSETAETAPVQTSATPAPNSLTGPHSLAQGEMKKLLFHTTPKAPFQSVFTDPEGGTHTLAEYRGQYILVNMWATWCAPCRKEMPTLDALQKVLGGDDFQVVTIATGRNAVAGITRFFNEAEVTHLPVLLDPDSVLAREMLVLGLPLTALLNREGQEIARLRGDAVWNSESALAVLRAVIDD